MTLSIHSKDMKAVPISEITTPKHEKICYGSAYWVTDGENVFFYKGKSKQCNSNIDVVRHLYGQDANIIHIPMAYLDHDCRGYYE